MEGRRTLAKRLDSKGLLKTLRPFPFVLETTMFRLRISLKKAEALSRAVLGILGIERTWEGRTTTWYV